MGTLNHLARLSAKPQRVEVEWIDSAGEQGWHDASAILDAVERPGYMTCHSAGYLVNETDAAVTIALSYTVDTKTGLHESYGDVMTIPRGAIVDMRDLRR